MVVTSDTQRYEFELPEWGEMYPMHAALAPMSAYDLNVYYQRWAGCGSDATAYPVDADAPARVETLRAKQMFRQGIMRAAFGGRA